jgi:hypothetical protein
MRRGGSRLIDDFDTLAGGVVKLLDAARRRQRARPDARRCAAGGLIPERGPRQARVFAKTQKCVSVSARQGGGGARDSHDSAAPDAFEGRPCESWLWRFRRVSSS